MGVAFKIGHCFCVVDFGVRLWRSGDYSFGSTAHYIEVSLAVVNFLDFSYRSLCYFLKEMAHSLDYRHLC